MIVYALIASLAAFQAASPAEHGASTQEARPAPVPESDKPKRWLPENDRATDERDPSTL